MSGDEEEKVETRGQMTQRHKREAMMLKKQTQKMGKKRKAEAKKLEQELAARHEEEIRRHEEREKAGHVPSVVVRWCAASVGQEAAAAAQGGRAQEQRATQGR